MHYDDVTTNPILADGRHIENRFLAISLRFIVRLTRNLCEEAELRSDVQSRDQISNFRKFKMADGRHFENGFIAISQLGITRFR